MSIFDQLKDGIIAKSVAETHALAAAVAQALPSDAVLTLKGDLGAGKTTFVQGLAKALEVRETIKSPTYNIFSIYQGRIQLVHMDAYRLNGANAMEELMLEEFLQSPYCLVIEWPEKIADWLPPQTMGLTFSIEKDHSRVIQSEDPTKIE